MAIILLGRALLYYNLITTCEFHSITTFIRLRIVLLGQLLYKSRNLLDHALFYHVNWQR